MRSFILFIVVFLLSFVCGEAQTLQKRTAPSYTITNNLSDIRADFVAKDSTVLKSASREVGEIATMTYLDSTNDQTNGGLFLRLSGSTYTNDAFNFFAHTGGGQWARISTLQKIYDGVYPIHPKMTETGVQAMLDLAETKTFGKVEFHEGSYTFSGNLELTDCQHIMVEGNNSNIDMQENIFYITTADTSSEYYYYYKESYADNDRVITPNKFTTNLEADSFWVGISDPDHFDEYNLTRGDAIVLGDSVTHSNAGSYYNGEIMYFEEFDTLGGPTYRMYFQKPALMDVKIMDSLRISWVVNSSGKTCNINGMNITDGSIIVTGFDNLNASNLNFVGTHTEWDATAPNVALGSYWNRSAQITNYFVKNYVRTGTGYGIGLDGFDDVNLVNFWAQGCRHVWTTNNSYGHWNHNIRVENGTAIMPYNTYQMAGGWSTHGNVWRTEFINTYTEGWSPAFGGRGHIHIIKNAVVKNCNVAVQAVRTGSQSDGKRLIVENMDLWNTRLFDTDGPGANHRYMRFSHIRQHGEENYVFGFDTNDSTSSIDTFIVENCDFNLQNNVADDRGYFFKETGWPAASVVSTDIGYMELNNVKVRGVWIIFYMTRNTINKLRAFDCEFTDFYEFYRTAYADSNANKNIDWEFTDCTFESDAATPWSLPAKNRFHKLKFIGGRSNECIGYLHRIEVDSLIYDGVEFEQPASQAILLGNGLDDVNHTTNAVVKNCIVRGATGTESGFINSYYHDGTLLIKDNTFLGTNTDRISYFYNADDVTFINNYIQIDSLVTDDDARSIYMTNDSHVGFIGNTIRLKTVESTAFDLFRLESTGDSLFATGNTFIIEETPPAGTVIFQSDAGSHINLGVNQLYGPWPTDVTTISGTQHYSPVMFHDVKFDSIYADTDSIKFIWDGKTVKLRP